MYKDNAVIILNLKSGVPQLTIDAGMEVYGLGVTWNMVVVIGSPKVIGWNLPTGDCVPNALAGLEDRAWTIDICSSQPHDRMICASTSPDSYYIAVINGFTLHIHRTSTGEHLVKADTLVVFNTLRFSPDGHNVSSADDQGRVGAWRVDGELGVLELLEYTADMEHPPGRSPWGSSRSYRVTNDWWIVGPDGKRVLMLPPPWRSYEVHRLWKGQFLALLRSGLSEPVILELDVNYDL